MPTPRNLTRHELIGLTVSVVESTNPAQRGIQGLVLDETKNTIVLTDGRKDRRLQKVGLTLQFTFSDSSSVEVSGDDIRGRPVDRVKMYRRRINERRRH